VESSSIAGEFHRSLVLHIMTTTASHTDLRHDVSVFGAECGLRSLCSLCR
jgi:hypothetical protein